MEVPSSEEKERLPIVGRTQLPTDYWRDKWAGPRPRRRVEESFHGRVPQLVRVHELLRGEDSVKLLLPQYEHRREGTVEVRPELRWRDLVRVADPLQRWMEWEGETPAETPDVNRDVTGGRIVCSSSRARHHHRKVISGDAEVMGDPEDVVHCELGGVVLCDIFRLLLLLVLFTFILTTRPSEFVDLSNLDRLIYIAVVLFSPVDLQISDLIAAVVWSGARLTQ